MMRIKTPTKKRIIRELEKREPKLIETGKKTLILHGTKTSNVLNAVLAEIYHLKSDKAIRYTKKNDNIRPLRAVAKLLWSSFLSKLIAVPLCIMSIDQLKAMNVDDILNNLGICLDFTSFFHIGPVNLFLDSRFFVFDSSGTMFSSPDLRLILIQRRRTSNVLCWASKPCSYYVMQEKNVKRGPIEGKIGKIYIPDQKVGSVPLPNSAKGVKRVRWEAKMTDEAHEPKGKKQKEDLE